MLVAALLWRNPQLSNIVGLPVGESQIRPVVRQEFGRDRRRHLPIGVGIDSVHADLDGTDARLGPVLNVPPLVVVVQVDPSCVLAYGMLAKHNDVIHSEWARVCAADCDDELLVAWVEIHAINHEVVARITVHRVHGIAGIVETSTELPFKARLAPKRRVIHIVEVHDLVTDKNSRRTGYGMLRR